MFAKDAKYVLLGLIGVFVFGVIIVWLFDVGEQYEHHKEECKIYNVSLNEQYCSYYAFNEEDELEFYTFNINNCSITLKFEEDVEPYMIKSYTVGEHSLTKIARVTHTTYILPNDIIYKGKGDE